MSLPGFLFSPQEKLYSFAQMATTTETLTNTRRVKIGNIGSLKPKIDRIQGFGTKYTQDRFLN
jgi:hypothetical protein